MRRATTACCSPPCRATTAPIRGWPRCRPMPAQALDAARPLLPRGRTGQSRPGAALRRHAAGPRRAVAAAGRRSGRSRCWARSSDARPVALVVFYRANLMAADNEPVTALMAALDREGLAPLAVAVSSLKDPAIEPATRAPDRDASTGGHPQHHRLLGDARRTTRRCSTPPTCRCCRSCCRAARARPGPSRAAACRRPISR